MDKKEKDSDIIDNGAKESAWSLTDVEEASLEHIESTSKAWEKVLKQFESKPTNQDKP